MTIFWFWTLFVLMILSGLGFLASFIFLIKSKDEFEAFTRFFLMAICLIIALSLVTATFNVEKKAYKETKEILSVQEIEITKMELSKSNTSSHWIIIYKGESENGTYNVYDNRENIGDFETGDTAFLVTTKSTWKLTTECNTVLLTEEQWLAENK